MTETDPTAIVSDIPDDVRHEWTELAEQAAAAQFAYHVKDAPTISDGHHGRRCSRAASCLPRGCAPTQRAVRPGAYAARHGPATGH